MGHVVMQWRGGTSCEVPWPLGRGRWSMPCGCAPGDARSVRSPTPALVGSLRSATAVLLNATALQRGLGTGGLAFVVAAPDRAPPPRDAVTAVRGPHRQGALHAASSTMVLGVDEQDSPHHAVCCADADDLAGMPVVVADLHSALPAVLAGLRAGRAVGAGGLRHDRRRRAAARLLPHGGRSAVEAGWLAGDRHGRAGLRR